MIIKNIQGAGPEKLRDAIVRWLLAKNGRFKADVKLDHKHRTPWIEISTIRLRVSKPYCGNHPASCEIGGGAHRKAKYLEGADWVQLNDGLNNLLDRLNVSADVYTSLVILRKGPLRRLSYMHHYPVRGRTAQWDKDAPANDWMDCRKSKAVPSDFAMGTPGIYRAANHRVIG